MLSVLHIAAINHHYFIKSDNQKYSMNPEIKVVIKIKSHQFKFKNVYCAMEIKRSPCSKNLFSENLGKCLEKYLGTKSLLDKSEACDFRKLTVSVFLRPINY